MLLQAMQLYFKMIFLRNINFLIIYMADKQKIIADIYFDPSGFGSKALTLKDAKAKDATITRSDVEKFFKENVDEKRKPRGMNSFVAPHNNHTFQMDLFFISQSDMRDEQNCQPRFGG